MPPLVFLRVDLPELSRHRLQPPDVPAKLLRSLPVQYGNPAPSPVDPAGPGIPDFRSASISPDRRSCTSSLPRVQRKGWERTVPRSTLAGLNIRARLPGLPGTTRR